MDLRLAKRKVLPGWPDADRGTHCRQEFVETGMAHSQAGMDMMFDKLKGERGKQTSLT
jgi:hypothetical protein